MQTDITNRKTLPQINAVTVTATLLKPLEILHVHHLTIQIDDYIEQLVLAHRKEENFFLEQGYSPFFH
jgi:hypothetical protein